MRYTKFHIKNYKGIPAIELDLERKPSSNILTLVGLNESGKTSILEAINFFQSGIAKSKAHTLIPKSRQHNFSDTTFVEAELKLGDDDMSDIKDHLKAEFGFIVTRKSKIIKLRRECSFDKSNPLEEKLNMNYWTLEIHGKTNRAKTERQLFEWNRKAWDSVTSLIRKDYMPKIIYYQNFLFEFPEKIYLEEMEGESREQAEYRQILQDILSSIEDDLTVQDSLLERAQNREQQSYKAALDQLLLKMSHKLNEEILGRWDTIFKGTQEKKVNISCNSENSESGDARHFIELKVEQGADSYSINDRSLGFRWFFSFLIFTSFRKSRMSDPGETLFLLDEPASNLHQSSQQKLLQDLANIVSDCKLIYSTHSHHMINPSWLAGTYIVKNKAINYDNPEEAQTTDTNISVTPYNHFVSQHPEESDHFQPILDALDYRPSQLEMVPELIFTEGKNDYYTFKYVNELIFRDKYPLYFYPGAGAGKYERIFRLYLAWNRKFIALFDSDGAGEKERRLYMKKMGPELDNRVFTLKDVAKSWTKMETEDLFLSVAEKNKIIQTCFHDYVVPAEGYDKSKFNTAIQSLYINKKTYEFNKATLARFEKVFAFLQEKLAAL